jgi:O-antigen ligase
MLVFICLMLLFLFQRLSILQLILGVMFLIGTVFLTYSSSDNFSNRIDEGILEIQNYKSGESRTSIGQRFDWWKTSAILIKEKPILGHGPGSFPIVHRQLTENTAIMQTDNPHNEFLFLTVQFGLLGLLLFGALVLSQFIGYKHISERKRCLLQGVILALLSGSLINSLLFDSQQGHFYLFMSAALMAGQTVDHRIIFKK